MDQQPTNGNKLLNILIVVLGLVLLGLAIFFAIRLFGNKPTGFISAPFAQNIRYPYKIDSNQIYFYTGHGFGSLDVKTGLTKQLGQPRIMPSEPTSVQWTKDGAYVQASSYTIFDELGAMVPSTSLGQDDKATYLWYVPFDGKPVVVDKNVSTFYADPNTGKAYYHWKINPGADGALLRTYMPSTNTQAKFMDAGVDGSFKIVFAEGETIWAMRGYGQATTLTRYGPTSSNEDLVTNIFGSSNATLQNPFVMINSRFYVAAVTAGEKSQLVAYDLAAKKSYTLESDFTGSINQGSYETVFANSSNGKKIKTTKINSPEKYSSLSAELEEGSISSTYDAGSNWISVDLLNRARVMSPDQEATQGWPQIKNSGLDKVIPNNEQYEVAIDLSNAATANRYGVIVYPPYEQNVANLMAAIKAAGYDPNQLDLVLNYTVKRQELQ